MNTWEEKQKEIATIKPRTIELNLSDADVMRLSQKAGTVGLTVQELLQSFIGDLVDGTYSNGSDEREYAQQWFERCGYEFEADEHLTFLNWLLKGNCGFSYNLCTNPISAMNLIDDFENMKKYTQQLDEMKKSGREKYQDYEGQYEDEIEYLEQELDSLQETLVLVFNNYTQECKATTTLEAEMLAVAQWYEDFLKLRGEKSVDNDEENLEEEN